MNIEVSTCILNITDNHFELIKMTLKVLGVYSHFNTLKIFDDEKFYEICTKSNSGEYVTRTLIGKTFWKIKECSYQIAGKEEVYLIKDYKKI